jgi:hypothetical protein
MYVTVALVMMTTHQDKKDMDICSINASPLPRYSKTVKQNRFRTPNSSETRNPKPQHPVAGQNTVYSKADIL